MRAVNPKDEICRRYLALREADCAEDRRIDRQARFVVLALVLAGVAWLAVVVALLLS